MNIESEPGFSSVLQSMAFTPQTPFQQIPVLGQTVTKDTKLTIVLEHSVVEHLSQLIADTPIESVPHFINNAVSVYGQMLSAAKDGYSIPVLLNPETSDIIPIHTAAE